MRLTPACVGRKMLDCKQDKCFLDRVLLEGGVMGRNIVLNVGLGGSVFADAICLVKVLLWAAV